MPKYTNIPYEQLDKVTVEVDTLDTAMSRIDKNKEYTSIIVEEIKNIVEQFKANNFQETDIINRNNVELCLIRNEKLFKLLLKDSNIIDSIYSALDMNIGNCISYSYESYKNKTELTTLKKQIIALINKSFEEYKKLYNDVVNQLNRTKKQSDKHINSTTQSSNLTIIDNTQNIDNFDVVEKYLLNIQDTAKNWFKTAFKGVDGNKFTTLSKRITVNIQKNIIKSVRKNNNLINKFSNPINSQKNSSGLKIKDSGPKLKSEQKLKTKNTFSFKFLKIGLSDSIKYLKKAEKTVLGKIKTNKVSVLGKIGKGVGAIGSGIATGIAKILGSILSVFKVVFGIFSFLISGIFMIVKLGFTIITSVIKVILGVVKIIGKAIFKVLKGIGKLFVKTLKVAIKSIKKLLTITAKILKKAFLLAIKTPTGMWFLGYIVGLVYVKFIKPFAKIVKKYLSNNSNFSIKEIPEKFSNFIDFVLSKLKKFIKKIRENKTVQKIMTFFRLARGKLNQTTIIQVLNYTFNTIEKTFIKAVDAAKLLLTHEAQNFTVNIVGTILATAARFLPIPWNFILGGVAVIGTFAWDCFKGSYDNKEVGKQNNNNKENLNKATNIFRQYQAVYENIYKDGSSTNMRLQTKNDLNKFEYIKKTDSNFIKPKELETITEYTSSKEYQERQKYYEEDYVNFLNYLQSCVQYDLKNASTGDTNHFTTIYLNDSDNLENIIKSKTYLLNNGQYDTSKFLKGITDENGRKTAIYQRSGLLMKYIQAFNSGDLSKKFFFDDINRILKSDYNTLLSIPKFKLFMVKNLQGNTDMNNFSQQFQAFKNIANSETNDYSFDDYLAKSAKAFLDGLTDKDNIINNILGTPHEYNKNVSNIGNILYYMSKHQQRVNQYSHIGGLFNHDLFRYINIPVYSIDTHEHVGTFTYHFPLNENAEDKFSMKYKIENEILDKIFANSIIEYTVEKDRKSGELKLCWNLATYNTEITSMRNISSPQYTQYFDPNSSTIDNVKKCISNSCSGFTTESYDSTYELIKILKFDKILNEIKNLIANPGNFAIKCIYQNRPVFSGFIAHVTGKFRDLYDDEQIMTLISESILLQPKYLPILTEIYINGAEKTDTEKIEKIKKHIEKYIEKQYNAHKVLKNVIKRNERQARLAPRTITNINEKDISLLSDSQLSEETRANLKNAYELLRYGTVDQKLKQAENLFILANEESKRIKKRLNDMRDRSKHRKNRRVLARQINNNRDTKADSSRAPL